MGIERDVVEISDKHIGGQVRKLRRELGLAPGELADRLSEHGVEVSGSGLTKWESGERRIQAQHLPALAAALGVTPNVLLLGLPEHPGELQGKTLNVAGHEVTLERAYEWAYGERPLSGGEPDTVDASDRLAQLEAELNAEAFRRQFQRVNRPYVIPSRLDIDGMMRLEKTGELLPLKTAVTELFKAGFTVDDLVPYMRTLYSDHVYENAPGDEVDYELGSDGFEAVEERHYGTGGELVQRTNLRGSGRKAGERGTRKRSGE